MLIFKNPRSNSGIFWFEWFSFVRTQAKAYAFGTNLIALISIIFFPTFELTNFLTYQLTNFPSSKLFN
ncbi:hypothetical protein EGI31_24350 [Lacihabitans soyangensis]|uniref:Uncharacterized protein n=1 Tax=Lacihabitans soyangensis TaxID=869394 RepID=A0AAE3H8F6_9BACT|nr:hypothetical protein [Lacihabitans soyangensis]